jgi:cytochrome c-type biogenesis protein CcmE
VVVVSTHWKIAITAAVAIGAASFLVTSALENAQHYVNVGELMSGELQQWNGKTLKISGLVQVRSIVDGRVGEAHNLTFVMHEHGKAIRVFFDGIAPDTLTDTAEVLAIGRLVPSSQMQARADALHVRLDDARYVFESHELSAKCPSKYKEVPPNVIEYR